MNDHSCCRVLFNSRLLDHQTWPRSRDETNIDAERQRHRGGDGVAGRKADDDGPREVCQQLRHHVAGGWITMRDAVKKAPPKDLPKPGKFRGPASDAKAEAPATDVAATEAPKEGA